VPNYLCLKVANNLNSYIMPNYFYGPGKINNVQSRDRRISQQTPYVDFLKDGTKYILDDELLIERHYHLCQNGKDFVDNFKKRYLIMDPSLLDNKNMIFEIDNEVDINEKV
jgi:hypothetical protein